MCVQEYKYISDTQRIFVKSKYNIDSNIRQTLFILRVLMFGQKISKPNCLEFTQTIKSLNVSHVPLSKLVIYRKKSFMYTIFVIAGDTNVIVRRSTLGYSATNLCVKMGVARPMVTAR